LVERKFYIFGMVFWPQDVIYLAALLIVSAYALFRHRRRRAPVLWLRLPANGLYPDVHVDRKLDRRRPQRPHQARQGTDGRPQAARQGHQAPALAALSLWTGFTLVGYFTPVSELINNVLTGNLGPWESFWIFFYGGFTYLFAGFMREQVCKYMCPYARFQSVMFDPDTLIITYDPERGETRGARKKVSTPRRPDWGLRRLRPVRAGLPDRHRHPQRPAIRVHRLRRLYRRLRPGHGQGRPATRPDPLLHRKRHGAAPWQEGHPGHRPPAHPALHRHPAVILGACAWFLAHRIPLKVDIIRDRSVLAREADDGRIENVYMLQIMNTEEVPHRYRVSVDGLAGAEIAGETEVDAAAAGLTSFNTVVRAARCRQDRFQPDSLRHRRCRQSGHQGPRESCFPPASVIFGRLAWAGTPCARLFSP
jgi:hypothetical protein